MATETKVNIRSKNIYQVFLRQHTKEGTFLSLIKDLPRIKSLGINYLYLMPFFPIGKVNRKGLVGSPYSVLDYMKIDPFYGSLEDFKTLVEKAKELDLEIMLDMVFHHTSHDATLALHNPNWYVRENGKPKHKVADWQDVIDFDYNNALLHDYLLDVILYWASFGVGAFRFDSASLIPLSFWRKVKKEVTLKHPNILFLGESAKPEFIKEKRDEGHTVLSDGELYQVFDVLYDYDVYDEYKNYLRDPSKLNNWLFKVYNQEAIYPENYIKLRSLENHDTPRVASYNFSDKKLINLTALLGYLKGVMLIYAGQEFKNNKRPSLFEIDKVNFDYEEKEINNLFHRVGHLRKDELFQKGIFKVHLQEKEVAVLSYENEMSMAYGIFNLGELDESIKINLKDGVYQNILYPNQVKVINKTLKLTDKPMILFAMKKQI